MCGKLTHLVSEVKYSSSLRVKERHKGVFLLQMPYLSFFSCLIGLARTSSAMLKRSGKSRHLCFILDLQQKASNFPPLIIIVRIFIDGLDCFVNVVYCIDLNTLNYACILEINPTLS